MDAGRDFPGANGRRAGRHPLGRIPGRILDKLPLSLGGGQGEAADDVYDDGKTAVLATNSLLET